MFGIVVRFDLRDAEAAASFDALVREVVPGILADEPGTLVYATHALRDDPLARIFYEIYRDEDAHQAHENRPATARFLRAMRPLTSSIRAEFVNADGGGSAT